MSRAILAMRHGAYLIIGARALGLDCGPVSGFSNEAVVSEFFANTRVKSNFICSIGYGSNDNAAWVYDPQLRSMALLELADRLNERAEAMALTLSREMGKTLRHATWEATVSPSTLRYNAGTALSQTGTSSQIAPGKSASW